MSTQLFQSLIISLNMIGLYTSPLFNSVLPERIGYVIQQKRKLLELTQEQLARRTHFSRYMISKIERGKHDIKITELERISFGLETTIKVLIVEV
jgi:predicted transcriptional regulator